MNSKFLRKALLATSTTLIVATGGTALLATSAHAESSTREGASTGEMFDDSVITTKVKAAFVQDETVSALRINVTSEKGVVQLSGFANSAREADRAAELAREIAGVREVKNDILLKQKP